MSNLGCGGPGESIDTHIVGVWNKKDEVTFGYPRCPQCPGGPESAQNVPFCFLGSEESNGAHIGGFCDKNFRGRFLKIFVPLFAFI